ncbi:thioesterase family protein [Alicyclobacillus sp. SO9]|uniref:acyl-CoA thioesterase n=1 Tax=Alicyclobacillus sp. SO9 TaxID=2665646 RepID=UPI0018E7D29B|nr:acyl-CoA thioesterase [Alicyclobacillus sp. SO9]QQE77629.1 acyl-CoA thioesterase [Alicyclobacillus sp. SO9]
MKKVVTTDFEVRWGECDPAGIVYHPVYIDWFSVARMHFLKENGISYMESFHDNGIVLVVLGVQSRYFKTLRAEDQVKVEARMEKLTRTRIEMAYRVVNAAGELCTEGKTEHAYVDERNRAVNVAKKLPEVWNLMQSRLQD